MSYSFLTGPGERKKNCVRLIGSDKELLSGKRTEYVVVKKMELLAKEEVLISRAGGGGGEKVK